MTRCAVAFCADNNAGGVNNVHNMFMAAWFFMVLSYARCTRYAAGAFRLLRGLKRWRERICARQLLPLARYCLGSLTPRASCAIFCCLSFAVPAFLYRRRSCTYYTCPYLYTW
jgi:hypothetical protein